MNEIIKQNLSYKKKNHHSIRRMFIIYIRNHKKKIGDGSIFQMIEKKNLKRNEKKRKIRLVKMVTHVFMGIVYHSNFRFKLHRQQSEQFVF